MNTLWLDDDRFHGRDAALRGTRDGPSGQGLFQVAPGASRRDHGHRTRPVLHGGGEQAGQRPAAAHRERSRSIFQTTSDTEVILHLIARSPQEDLESAIVDALKQVEGAYSLVFLLPGRIIAVRDPRG